MESFDSQPNFFEGQPLGPEELNQIAEFSATRQSTYMGLLARKGGILRWIGQELQVVPVTDEGLFVKVLEGAAISESGYLFDIRQALLLDLTSARPIATKNDMEGKVVYIYLVKHTTLERLTRDPEFPEFQGFAEKKLGFKLIASDQKEIGPDAIELARVFLTPSTSVTRSFKSNGHSNLHEPGVINVLHRRYLSPLGGNQITDAERIELLQGIQDARSTLLQAVNVFHMKEPETLAIFFYTLKVELSRAVIDDLVLAGVLSDALPVVASLLEEVRNLLASNTTVSDERIPTVDELLTRIRGHLGQRKGALIQLNELIVICQDLGIKVLRSGHQGEYYLRVANAIRSMRDQPFRATNNVAPAGSVFTLRDTIDVKAITERAQIDSAAKEQVMISGKYRSGEGDRILGMSVPGGKIKVPLQNLQPGKDVLIIGRNYKRRKDVEVAFSCNGKEIHRESTSEVDPLDGLVTYGFVIPGDLISHKDNSLNLEIKRLEVTYPFLGLYVYQ